MLSVTADLITDDAVADASVAADIAYIADVEKLVLAILAFTVVGKKSIQDKGPGYFKTKTLQLRDSLQLPGKNRVRF